MAKKRTYEVEAGLPGLGKAKISQTEQLTKTTFRYSCAVHFDSMNAAQEFRGMVEGAIASAEGEMSESHIDTIEKTTSM